MHCITGVTVHPRVPLRQPLRYRGHHLAHWGQTSRGDLVVLVQQLVEEELERRWERACNGRMSADGKACK